MYESISPRIDVLLSELKKEMSKESIEGFIAIQTVKDDDNKDTSSSKATEKRNKIISMLSLCTEDDDLKIMSFPSSGLDNLRIEDEIIFNYQWFEGPCSQLIEELKRREDMVAKYPRPITIRLHCGYFEDKKTKELCTFILESKSIQNNLVKLDLSNNRLTPESLPILRSIVESCPKLETLDISINLVSSKAFNNIFGTLSEEQKKKVEFSVY